MPSGKHRHKYSAWKLRRCSINPKPHLSDEEYIAALRFPPMWGQECECGFSHFIRWPRKPKASVKFREIAGRRVLG